MDKSIIYFRLSFERIANRNGHRGHDTFLVTKSYRQFIWMNVYVNLARRDTYPQQEKRKLADHESRIIGPLRRIAYLLGFNIASVYINTLLRAVAARKLIVAAVTLDIEIPVVIIHGLDMLRGVSAVYANKGIFQ